MDEFWQVVNKSLVDKIEKQIMHNGDSLVSCSFEATLMAFKKVTDLVTVYFIKDQWVRLADSGLH